jgi:beta-lactamase class A
MIGSFFEGEGFSEVALASEAANVRGVVGVVVSFLDENHSVVAWNEDEVFPAASLIKLPLLWHVFSEVEKGKVSLDRIVPLDGRKKVGGFGILKDLHDGLCLTIEDLATVMIVLSDNTATNILLDMFGMDAVNRTIAHLGMKQTVLRRKMMDAEAKARGLDNVTSPGDVARFFEHLLYGKTLSQELREKMVNILKRQQCNNKFPSGLPEGAVLAHKTGDLPGTEHDAGVLFRQDEPAAILVVLTKDLKENAEGVRFCQNVARAVFARCSGK